MKFQVGDRVYFYHVTGKQIIGSIAYIHANDNTCRITVEGKSDILAHTTWLRRLGKREKKVAREWVLKFFSRNGINGPFGIYPIGTKSILGGSAIETINIREVLSQKKQKPITRAMIEEACYCVGFEKHNMDAFIEELEAATKRKFK